LTERRYTALGLIRREKPPTRGSGVGHLFPFSQPRPLTCTHFPGNWLDIPDQTQQNCEIDPLVVGHVIDLHSARLQEDGTQQARNRYGSTPTPDPDVFDARPVKRLRSARHLDGMEFADGQT
jgi:hypothetical protein